MKADEDGIMETDGEGRPQTGGGNPFGYLLHLLKRSNLVSK